MDITKQFHITRIKNGEIERIEDLVVCEYSLTIYINKKNLITFLCTPRDMDYLIFGFLLAEGIVNKKSDIKSINIDTEEGLAFIELDKSVYEQYYLQQERNSSKTKASSGASITNNIYSNISYKPRSLELNHSRVISLMNDFMRRSEVFEKTGGVHSAALCDRDKILIFHEDIGRHNALDKVIGQAFSEDLDLTDKIVLTSGRISSEMVMKALKRGIPVFISHSAPMDLALEIGDNFGMTLIGFARGNRFNIYTGEKRITLAVKA